MDELQLNKGLQSVLTDDKKRKDFKGKIVKAVKNATVVNRDKFCDTYNNCMKDINSDDGIFDGFLFEDNDEEFWDETFYGAAPYEIIDCLAANFTTSDKYIQDIASTGVYQSFTKEQFANEILKDLDYTLGNMFDALLDDSIDDGNKERAIKLFNNLYQELKENN